MILKKLHVYYAQHGPLQLAMYCIWPVTLLLAITLWPHIHRLNQGEHKLPMFMKSHAKNAAITADSTDLITQHIDINNNLAQFLNEATHHDLEVTTIEWEKSSQASFFPRQNFSAHIVGSYPHIEQWLLESFSDQHNERILKQLMIGRNGDKNIDANSSIPMVNATLSFSIYSEIPVQKHIHE